MILSRTGVHMSGSDGLADVDALVVADGEVEAVSEDDGVMDEVGV